MNNTHTRNWSELNRTEMESRKHEEQEKKIRVQSFTTYVNVMPILSSSNNFSDTQFISVYFTQNIRRFVTICQLRTVKRETYTVQPSLFGLAIVFLPNVIQIPK